MASRHRPLAPTRHSLIRKGRDLRVSVMEIRDDRDGGHALVVGEPVDGCLVRIHSRCLYGEALGSDDCDCGPELDKALDLIQAAGAGVLVYLDQEGRGAGLIAKARGYQQSQLCGTDTFTSYEALGYPPDARSFTPAAQCLATLGLRSVRLLTSNPDKAAAVREVGIEVAVVDLTTEPRSERARAYQDAKRRHRLKE